MSTHADSARNCIRALMTHWRSASHLSHDTAFSGYLHALQSDVGVTSPKIYESGVVTRLDLRLVDLYGDDATARDKRVPPPGEHDLAC